MVTVKEITQESVIESAFFHVYKSRLNLHRNDDIWHGALHWDQIKPKLIPQLQNGTYRFNLENVAHVKDHGGLKGAVRKAIEYCRNNNPYIYKIDVKDFYENIDHQFLLDQLKKVTHDQRLLNLMMQYCERVGIVKGEYILVEDKGIPKGCSLSPLIGSVYLSNIDEAAKRLGVHYVRYIDDLLFISQKRWKLKNLIKKVHGLLMQVKQSIGINKNSIDRAKGGFEWLGFIF